MDFHAIVVRLAINLEKNNTKRVYIEIEESSFGSQVGTVPFLV